MKNPPVLFPAILITMLSILFTFDVSAQLGCGGFDGSPSPSGSVAAVGNGTLCMNKPSPTPGSLSISVANAADGNNPMNFSVVIDWDDNSPLQTVSYGGAITVQMTAPHRYEIPSVTHIFLPKSCNITSNACSYRPRVWLRMAGVTCTTQFGTSPDFFRYNTDDQCSGTMRLTETVTSNNIYLASPGESVTFTDRTTLNCLPPQELTYVNASRRWRQFVYGVSNNMTGQVQVNGSPQAFPFTPAGSPQISSQPLATSASPFPSNNTATITIPATAQAGEEFHIRMDYWNVCNPFGTDPPVQETAIIRVAGKANQTITFTPPATLMYGDMPLTLSASSSSGLPVTLTSSDNNIATIAGQTLTIKSAGSVVIIASQSGNASYNAATPVNKTISVNKALLNVKADNKSRVYGGANPSLTISYAGFKYTDNSSAIDVVPTASVNALATSSTGTYTISPAGGSDNNYQFSYTNGNLSITTAPLKVIADDKTRRVSLPNPVLTISYIGFMNSENSTVIDTPPTIATTATSSSAAGIYPINVTGGDDNNYHFIYTAGKLTVTSKLSQSITFQTVADVSETAGSFKLVATTSSGLPVSFATNSSHASISENIVSIKEAGRVTIAASQAGNSDYNAASSVTQTFCITPKTPEITVAGPDSPAPVLTSSSTVGNTWYRDGQRINGATDAVYNPTSDGTYQLQVTIDGCESDLSPAVWLIVTGIESKDASMTMCIYPNPTTELLNIRLMRSPGKTTMKILDSDGRIVKSAALSDINNIIDVSSLRSGQYWIRIVYSGKESTTRFIKL